MTCLQVGFAGGAFPPQLPSFRGPVIAPAFQAVYAGYVLPVGAKFYQEDLTQLVEFIPELLPLLTD